MTQKSTQTHDVKVAILKINIYLYHARFLGESCSTSISCEPELHIINTTTYTPWPRSSAHEHQGWDWSCKVGGICMSEAPSSDWVVASYPRAVKSQRQKKGGHQSMAPLQGTTAAVYPRSLAGCLPARLFPHTQSCTDRQAGRQEGRKGGQLPSLPFRRRASREHVATRMPTNEQKKAKQQQTMMIMMGWGRCHWHERES